MYAASKTLIYAAALGAALQGVVALPASGSRHALRAPGQVITSCTVPNTIAITFDDGPYTWTREIVDALDAAGAKGTFFVNGNNFGCIYDGQNPGNLKYAYDRGHQIASHTWAHLHLPTLSQAQIESEFSRTNDAIKKITGAVPAFMRPPFGEYNDDVVSVAQDIGQTVTIWDFDSGDAAGKSAQESENAYEALISQNPKSILTLNHETHSSTVHELLPGLLDYLQGKKYRLVTVAECLGADPYLSTGAASKPDASWSC